METVWRTSTELKKLGLPSTTLFRAGKEGKIATRIDKKGSREVILYNFRDCIKFFNINQLPHEIIEQEEQGNETKRNNPNPGNHSVNAGLALGVLKDAFEGQIEHLSQRADDWKKRALHYEKEISGLRFQLENSPKPQQWILLEKQNKSLKKWLTIKTFFMATLVLALGISIPKLIFHQSYVC